MLLLVAGEITHTPTSVIVIVILSVFVYMWLSYKSTSDWCHAHEKYVIARKGIDSRDWL